MPIFSCFKHCSLTTLFILCCYLPLQAHSCSLSMGWEEWQPYAYKNASGELTGLDIELVTSILENMNCQLQLKNMPWKRLLNDTKEGNNDLVSGASITEERKQWGQFTLPYRQETRALFVRKGTSEKFAIHQLQDMVSAKFKLGLTRGVYNGDAFAKMMENPEFKKLTQVVSKESINPKKLVKNRIDGYVADAISGSQILRDMGLSDKIEIHPYTIYAADVHVLMSKKSTNPELLEKFNNSLAQLQSEGKLQAIINRYLQQ
ncbi:transporter substrate-binding domain-containing protein [Dasania marina]|uniref:substrate-binding periplasmic protein n=1 Tax=Dasania marina TaxID=471499 RepID=UPI0030DB987D